MRTVAVTGASGPVGKALLERLDADRDVGRIIGLDTVEPEMPVAKLEFRVADLRDPLLPHQLSGADAVAHLAFAEEVTAGEDALFAANVNGTRHLLDAAAKIGASTFVHLSSGLAYGAHPDNDVPLTEDSPLRATPDLPSAYHRLLAEELVRTWADNHPGIATTVLRPATVLGPGVDNAASRHLESLRLPLVRGYEPPLQLLHVDDLASALHLALAGGLSGVYNVAADGWLSMSEAVTLLGRKPLRLPETVAFQLARWLWERGLAAMPPGALPYLMEPWVLATDRIVEAGWTPTRSNREVAREFAAAHHEWVTAGRLRMRRGRLRAGLAGSGCALAALVGAGVLRLRRRRRRPARARSRRRRCRAWARRVRPAGRH